MELPRRLVPLRTQPAVPLKLVLFEHLVNLDNRPATIGAHGWRLLGPVLDRALEPDSNVEIRARVGPRFRGWLAGEARATVCLQACWRFISAPSPGCLGLAIDEAPEEALLSAVAGLAPGLGISKGLGL